MNVNGRKMTLNLTLPKAVAGPLSDALELGMISTSETASRIASLLLDEATRPRLFSRGRIALPADRRPHIDIEDNTVCGQFGIGTKSIVFCGPDFATVVVRHPIPETMAEVMVGRSIKDVLESHPILDRLANPITNVWCDNLNNVHLFVDVEPVPLSPPLIKAVKRAVLKQWKDPGARKRPVANQALK